MSLPTSHRPPHRGAVLVAALAAIGLLAGCAQESVKTTRRHRHAPRTPRPASPRPRRRWRPGPSRSPTYPEEPALSTTVDMAGKNVVIIPLGDQIPVIHGVAVGIAGRPEGRRRHHHRSATASSTRPRSPTASSRPATRARTRSSPSSSTTRWPAPPSTRSPTKGVHVLIGGVAPTGGRTSDKTLAFYDNTGRVNKLYDAMSISAVANGGEDTKVLWLRLMDSTTTRGASDQGSRDVREAVPDVRRRDSRLHHRQPRQAAVRGERRAGLAPGHQHDDRAGRQLRRRPHSRACRAPASAARSRSSPPAPTSPGCSASRTASRSPTSAPRSSTRAGSTPTASCS